MKKYLSSLIFAVVITLSFSTIANAALSLNIKNQSTKFLDSGNAQAAYNLLKIQIKSNPQDWFLYGMAAHKAGKLDDAELAYRRVLQLSPSSQRAKLELGRVLTDKGELLEAKRLLLDVKATNPPAKVIQNIDRFLALIKERENKNAGWQVRSSVGVIYDSNVNNGTNVDTITMFGLPFTLSDDAKAQSDIAYTLRFEAEHLAKISPSLSWKSNFSFNWTDYFKLNKFDVLQLSASTGFELQLDQQTTFSLPLTAGVISYTDKGSIYSTSIGSSPQLLYQLNETIALNLGANVNWKYFIDNSARNTLSYSVAPAIDIRTCGKGKVRFGGNLGRDSSGIDTYSNNNWALNASLSCPLGSDMWVSVYGNYGGSNYDTREAAYSVTRQDRKATVGANLQYAYQPWGLDITLGGGYTNNKSNLDLYTYEKFQGTFSAKKKF